MTTAARLRLLSRPGCHLCEEMAQALGALGMPFHRVNVEEHPPLEAEFGAVIPVLFHNDVEIARAPQSVGTLQRALRRAGVI